MSRIKIALVGGVSMIAMHGVLAYELTRPCFANALRACGREEPNLTMLPMANGSTTSETVNQYYGAPIRNTVTDELNVVFPPEGAETWRRAFYG